MTVIGSKSGSQEQKGAKVFYSRIVKLRSALTSSVVEERAMKFTYSLGFSDMADRMVWRHLCHVITPN